MPGIFAVLCQQSQVVAEANTPLVCYVGIRQSRIT